jgi:hypothetical protein
MKKGLAGSQIGADDEPIDIDVKPVAGCSMAD